MKIIALLLFLVAAAAAKSIVLNQFMRPTGVERFKNVLKAVEHSRIIGGIESVPHSKPYQVGLFLTYDVGTGFCGGSLISKTFVMTAANCVNDGRHTVSLFTVVLGAHNIYDEDNSVRLQSRIAIMHPGWNPLTLHNDIALIKLPTEAPINDNIQLVTLPPYSAVASNFAGVASTVSGWGLTADKDNQISENLREITVNAISNIVCNVKYLGVAQSTNVCTDGTNNKGSCHSDNGGPVTALYNGRKVQIGIVSFGSNLGCEVGWPSVHTRVTSYLYWIGITSGVDILP